MLLRKIRMFLAGRHFFHKNRIVLINVNVKTSRVYLKMRNASLGINFEKELCRIRINVYVCVKKKQINSSLNPVNLICFCDGANKPFAVVDKINFRWGEL